MMNKDLWITGIVPAVYTPMKDDGSLNLSMVAPIVELPGISMLTSIFILVFVGLFRKRKN